MCRIVLTCHLAKRVDLPPDLAQCEIGRTYLVPECAALEHGEAAATVSPVWGLSPTAGACGNHGPIVGAPMAPHIAAPVPPEIVVRIAIFRRQDDWRRRIPIHGMGPDVRLVTNCVGKCAGAGERERRG